MPHKIGRLSNMQEPGGVFLPLEDREGCENQETGLRSFANYESPLFSEQSLWLPYVQQSSGFSAPEAREAGQYSEVQNALSCLELSPPVSHEKLARQGDIPGCSKEILHCFEMGDSSGSKRNNPASSRDMLWGESNAYSCPEAREGAHFSDIQNILSSVELLPSSALEEVARTGEVPCSKEILHGWEKGQSSGSRRNDAANFRLKQQGESDEDTMNEDSKTSGPKKRTRSAEVHNLTERLRRRRLKEKMRSLQELIPNCNKRDKASTLDDAIKYIKTLQYQIQMMSMGVGSAVFRPPWMMHPVRASGQHQGIQVPSFPRMFMPRARVGTGYAMGMPSSFMFPMNQMCVLPPCSLAPATSGLPWMHEFPGKPVSYQGSNVTMPPNSTIQGEPASTHSPPSRDCPSSQFRGTSDFSSSSS